MAKRVFWKKGMRLTDEILTVSDKCTDQLIRFSLTLNTAGRMGLFSPDRQFKLSADISDTTISITELNCLGVTRDGHLIDTMYDTNYSNPFDTQTIIKTPNQSLTYLLCIGATDEWCNTNDNDSMCTQKYIFCCIEETSTVPANTLPIARIIYDNNCWRIDDNDFVPPCLYISSHKKYVDSLLLFSEHVKHIEESIRKCIHTSPYNTLKTYWLIIKQLQITIDKEADSMSPMTLFANIQKCVSGYLYTCMTDDKIVIPNISRLEEYTASPCDFRNTYKKIKEGVELCEYIFKEIESLITNTPQIKIPSPTLSGDQLSQKTSINRIVLSVNNVNRDMNLFYSIDGSDPNIKADKEKIVIHTKFKKTQHPEPDIQINLKLKNEMNGAYSDISTYTINVTKDCKNVIDI